MNLWIFNDGLNGDTLSFIKIIKKYLEYANEEFQVILEREFWT